MKQLCCDLHDPKQSVYFTGRSHNNLVRGIEGYQLVRFRGRLWTRKLSDSYRTESIDERIDVSKETDTIDLTSSTDQ